MIIKKQDLELCYKHLRLVLETNKKINLTSINEFEAGKIFHIEDSLSALNEINKFQINNIIDLGSGGGFPGIPLAIATGLKTTLVETTTKKADCLKFFISKLNLENRISVINDRIENIDTEIRYDLVTARALSSLNSLLELASPIVQLNKYFIAYKGKNAEDEIVKSSSIINKLGFELILKRKYILSDNKTEHYILLFKKINESKIKLPRKIGFAQKKPLK